MAICKNRKCRREIPDNSMFCNWCGTKQIKDVTQKEEIKVPEPRQLPSGNWFIQLRAEGESVTEKSKAACLTKARAIRAGYIQRKKKAEDITLSQAIDKYIDSKKNRLQERSIGQYEYIRDHRFEGIMSLPLKEITSEKLDEALDKELGKPSRKGGTISPKTVNDAYFLIVTVIKKYAKETIIETSPAEVQRSFTTILEPDDIYRAIKGTDIELTCLLSMWLSLSISEIRGLTKSKSILNGKLYIIETVVDVPKKGAVRKSLAKEENRPRALSIPTYIQSLIDNVDGDIIEPRSSHAVYMRFQKVLEDAGLPSMRVHDLRHVNASVMEDLKIPDVIKQDRGGWKTDSTLKKVYTHSFSSSRKLADEKIDEYFNSIVESNK